MQDGAAARYLGDAPCRMRNDPDRRQRPASSHHRRRRPSWPRNGLCAKDRHPRNGDRGGEDRGRTTCHTAHEPFVRLDSGTSGHHHLRRLLLRVLGIPERALPRLAFTASIGLSWIRGLEHTRRSGAISGSMAFATLALAASRTSRRERAGNNSPSSAAGTGKRRLVDRSRCRRTSALRARVYGHVPEMVVELLLPSGEQPDDQATVSPLSQATTAEPSLI